MGWREIAIFVPLIVLTLLLGFYPKPVLDVSAASVTALLDGYQHALAAKSASADAGGGDRPMNAVPSFFAAAVLPEIVLALGAMALLMLGAYREQDAAVSVSVLSVLLLVPPP